MVMEEDMFTKREGTSGIRGQLYETKLISLIYFRAIHNENIEEFHLGTNIDQVGAFDDICFKAKIKNCDIPLVVFVQAKHRENVKLAFNIEDDLAKYFDSYLNIKHAFESNTKDALFNETFNKIECIFVMYTTVDFKNASVMSSGSSYTSLLNDLIGTDGGVKVPNKDTEDVTFLCKIVMKNEITSLAVLMVKFINGEGNIQMMLDNDFILRYHVILTQKVLHVSETQPDGYRNATFRNDFFDNNEEYLVLLKDTLYTEILKEHRSGDKEDQMDEEKMTLLSDFFNNPSEVTILSKLIDTVIIYNNGQLEFARETVSETLQRQLKAVYVPQSAVKQAVERAQKDKISPKSFRVPSSFGNKDLTIRGNDVKIEKRLNHLSSKIFELLDKSKSSSYVILDDSLGSGVLQLNGGLAGAVGNLLVHDEETKMIRFTDNRELLGDVAKRLFDKLLGRCPDLQKYKFKLKVKKFPKLSLDYGEHEESLARDFLNKLVYYTNQANENDVEEILKGEIEDDQRNYANSFQIKTDAMFSNFHDEIQKWWMKPKKAPYLTKKSKLFENSIKNIVKDPLMSVMHTMYLIKTKHMNHTFRADAVTSLKLHDQKSTAVIITESSALTVAKVMQYLNSTDHVVLDIEYIFNLPKYDRDVLLAELTSANDEKALILVCEKIPNSVNANKILQTIAKAVRGKYTIVVTNRLSVGMIKKYFFKINTVVYDERNSLYDLSEESQMSILESARAIFQGKEVSLSLILNDELKACVEGDVLNSIINKETVVVGKPFRNSNYEEIKYLYVKRRVKNTRNDEDIVLETFQDISDDVVLLTAKPGMGKSTLLTHLSIETKELHPTIWIVRVNLLEYSRELSTWKDNETVIDSLETLNFMCQVVLRERLGKNNKVEIALEEANGIVGLRGCTGDQWTVFELKVFLHYYNKNTLIFLFDGFDEICPDYTNEVMKCLKTVGNDHRKHRMWVTSRSYNDIKTILEQEFGMSYEIECFSYEEREKYLDLFWKTNLRVKEFDSGQLENVRNFLGFMWETCKRNSQVFYREYTLLFVVYIYGGHFLINEIENPNIPFWKYNYHTLDGYCNGEKDRLKCTSMYDTTMLETPLNLYLAADYFIRKLQEFDKKTDNWDIDINTFAIYERFLETKLKIIRFQGKNAMDMDNPDIKIVYNKERADFVTKHKELAAYAIFREHSENTLFDGNQLKRIEDTIRFVEKGGEKTGLIHSIENHMPIFVHLTFAEYFAVDYLCDLLKNEDLDEIKQRSLMDLTFNVIFSEYRWQHVRKILDYKIKFDKELIRILVKNKSVVFESIMEQGNIHLELTPATDPNSNDKWLLHVAVRETLNNFMHLFILVLATCLNKDNFKDFLAILKATGALSVGLTKKYYDFILFVIKMTRKLNMNLSVVLCDSLRFLSRSANFDRMTDEEILQRIQKNFWEIFTRSSCEYVINDENDVSFNRY